MSGVNLTESGTLSSMNTEEGTDPLDTFIRQNFGEVSLIPFSMSSGSPVQWVQLLHHLEGSGLNTQNVLGWPLMSQPKMQKCEKCSREFWSPINYRRHVRVHRRSLRENHENRDLLAAFWDTLSLEQRKELMSFTGVMLKDIPGLEIVTALTSSLHPPVGWSFSPVCANAGSALVDIIQAKPSRLPIPSHELFSVLDDASEGTFLCAGTAESVLKYVFEGNTAKNSLELNNLVASTGFLFEQQLVKAWFADKDAEALRCQKLLVEEEEAAQRRQNAILEKKRQKKLRREQKMKEVCGDKQVLDVIDSVDSPTLTEAFDLSSPREQKMKEVCGDKQVLDVIDSVDSPTLTEAFDLSSPSEQKMKEVCGDKQVLDVIDSVDSPNLTEAFDLSSPREQKMKEVCGDKQVLDVIDSVDSPTLTEAVDLSSPNFKSSSPDAPLNIDSTLESLQFESDIVIEAQLDLSSRHILENSEEDKCDDVIIGSIPITLKNRSSDVIIGSIPIKLKSSVSSLEERSSKENLTKTETLQSPPNRVVSKYWGPESCGENKNSVPVNSQDQAISGEQSQTTNSDYDNQGEPLVSSNANVLEGTPFCSASAEESLARSCKEANPAEHVKSVISSPTELPPRKVQKKAGQGNES